jgi:T-complex protein 1 subunit alpha
MSLSLDQLALGVAAKKQTAIAAFAASLIAVPKILAGNAALDAIELVGSLRAAHYAAQAAGQKCFASLGLFKGGIQNGFEAG